MNWSNASNGILSSVCNRREILATSQLYITRLGWLYDGGAEAYKRWSTGEHVTGVGGASNAICGALTWSWTTWNMLDDVICRRQPLQPTTSLTSPSTSGVIHALSLSTGSIWMHWTVAERFTACKLPLGHVTHVVEYSSCYETENFASEAVSLPRVWDIPLRRRRYSQPARSVARELIQFVALWGLNPIKLAYYQNTSALTVIFEQIKCDAMWYDTTHVGRPAPLTD